MMNYQNYHVSQAIPVHVFTSSHRFLDNGRCTPQFATESTLDFLLFTSFS